MNVARTTVSWSIQQVARTGSTNADVAAAARAGAPEGLVVVADEQVAGRGRLGRTWSAPPGTALTASFLLRPDAVPAARWPWLPLLVGLAVAEAVDTVRPRSAAVLKWPNDVLLAGAKLAGILVERVDTVAGAAAVVGVGLNLSQPAEQLPVGATSLALGGAGEAPDRATVLAVLGDRLGARYAPWRGAAGRLADPAVTELAASYRARCETVGRDVVVRLPGGDSLRGRATGIDDDGRLVVRTPGGPVPVGAGDVVHVRPAG